MPDADWLHLTVLIQKHWGIRELRQLQEPALRASMSQRDSLVVLPTGGGKSLCFQAPALIREKPTVVVSPLIALMKDQVDGLRSSGITAARIDSSLTETERRNTAEDLRAGKIKLLYVSPERMALDGFRAFLQTLGVDTFAIDEAHCISHWGHDFRPEYRQLGALKQWFPTAAIHAYTATATELVRADIVKQLNLRQPEILVGNFDRPNLTYRVLPRERDVESQLLDLLSHHRGSAGIIYVMRRADADGWSSALRSHGIKAIGYHAGMEAADRKRAQEQFINEDVDVVVATVAFGMGIDRSNVRIIIHLGMPKSLEQYQQEAGRAGRDGLPGECVLLHSLGDMVTWKRMFQKTMAEANPPLEPAFIAAFNEHLEAIARYCRGTKCRHKSLVEYFGHKYREAPCQACDVCLANVQADADSLVNAQKILSCVARVNQSFGFKHVIDVLRGKASAKALQHGHTTLSTFGLLAETPETTLRTWIDQLLDQQVLVQNEVNGFPVLVLNDASWEVMRGHRTVTLIKPQRQQATSRGKSASESWEGVDSGLFEALRALRKSMAGEQHVPPFVIFNDASLRDLARIRPSTVDGMLRVTGVGAVKLASYGDPFFSVLDNHCREYGLSRDCAPLRTSTPTLKSSVTKSTGPAFALFRQGQSIEEVMQQMGRARSTVVGYLNDFIEREQPASIETWVRPEIYGQVADVAKRSDSQFLKPIFEALDGQVPYDAIRLVVTHLRAKENQTTAASST